MASSAHFRLLLASAPPIFVPAAGLLFGTSIGAAVSLPVFPGFALSVAALLVYFDSRRTWVLALSGAIVSVAILFRVNFGAYVVAVICLDILLRGIQPSSCGSRSGIKTAAAFLSPFVLCTAALCFLIYGGHSARAISEFVGTAHKLMALRGFITLGLTAEVACAVALPAGWFFFRSLSGSSSLVSNAFFPALLLVLFPFVTAIAGGSVSVVLWSVAAEIVMVAGLHLFVYPIPRFELLTLLFYCCLLHYFLSRADWLHWRILPMGIALLMCFRAIEAARSSAARWSTFAFLVTAPLILFCTESFRPSVPYAKSGVHLLARLISHPHMNDTNEVLDQAVPAAGWATVYQDRDEIEALRFLRARTTDADPIFVGVHDHSRIFWNGLRFYWLANRPIATHTFQLETRVATEEPVQRQIIEDLRSHNVRWIVLDCALQQGDETFMREAYQGSTLLDRYIASNFVERRRFGWYAVFARASL